MAVHNALYLLRCLIYTILAPINVDARIVQGRLVLSCPVSLAIP